MDETDSTIPTAGARVHLLVSHDRNRGLLADRLSDDYEVTDTDVDLSTAEFDLCIVDTAGFERHHDALAARKSAAHPVFLPSVLLTDSELRGRIPDAVWDVVDELLATPLDERELGHRVENLLERRQLSQDLYRRAERSERRFETLFDAAPDPILVTSAEGRISDVNDAFARAFDRDRDSVVGESVTDLDVTPTEAVERVLLRVEDAPEANTVEWDLGDGDHLITELNADVVRALGTASERIGIFRDVTERVAREETLHDQNDRLKEFASTIAHDLRNPLTIAQGHLDLVDASDDDNLAAVTTAHDRMEELIDELLTLARGGQVVLEPTPVSLKDVAERAWRHTDTRNATLTAEDASLLADENRLVQVFENLFRNSVEHGDDIVHVTVTPLPDGFAVEDDGPGIPDADRDSVFEAGYTTSSGGTGFGLSIVRQIAGGHGWTLSVTSGAAGGARFEFRDVDRVDD